MTDDRAVSSTVGFVLNLAIATLLVSSLLIAAGNVVDDRRESAARGELRIVGQRLAANLMTADRLAGAGGETVRVDADLPDRIAGGSYIVTVNGSAPRQHIELVSPDTDVRVVVYFESSTTVEDATLDGGDVQVVRAGDGDLEVRRP
ncbi:hypothetical protein ACFQH6_09700 [Halobacteriaceae archaeon GCM10025711]